VDAFSAGQAIYDGQCAQCHQADGSGGAFPALTDVEEHFPDFRDQMMWVRLGSDGWPADTYGATDISVAGGMPGFAGLTDQELAQVILYERERFGGIPVRDEEVIEVEGSLTTDGDPLTEQHLLQIAEGELTWADIGPGPLSEAADLEQADVDAVATGPGGGGGDGH
jgi:hypothetical protein